nr:DUF2164 family protein [Rossellomorea aquimaris]
MLTIKMTKEEKEEILGRIQTFHYEQHGEEIGMLGAENLLSFSFENWVLSFIIKG